jgi:hypothetical protein
LREVLKKALKNKQIEEKKIPLPLRLPLQLMDSERCKKKKDLLAVVDKA